jgi:predicted O-methyltransferase YrrM
MGSRRESAQAVIRSLVRRGRALPAGLVQPRRYVAAWKVVRIAGPPWRRDLRRPERKLARAALRRGAAQKIRELTELIALVGDRLPRTVLEIGTDLGGSLYVWCRLADPAATIISIDLPGGRFGRRDAVGAASHLVSYAGAGQQLHLLHLDSHDSATRAEVEQILAGRGIDLLMIDGDHTYDGVKADFDLYSPLVAAGGLIVLHDILPNALSPACEVERFWNELRLEHRAREIVDRYDDRGRGMWGGIGVIEWRPSSPGAA